MATPYSNVNTYRQNSVASATPLQLVIMLYDGALRFIRAGKQAVLQESHFVQNEQITKAQRIITELMSCLDMEKGGEIAKNLMALYSYVYDQLVQANINDDASALDRCEKVLCDLRESWSELDKQQRATAQANAASPGFGDAKAA